MEVSLKKGIQLILNSISKEFYIYSAYFNTGRVSIMSTMDKLHYDVFSLTSLLKMNLFYERGNLILLD